MRGGRAGGAGFRFCRSNPCKDGRNKPETGTKQGVSMSYITMAELKQELDDADAAFDELDCETMDRWKVALAEMEEAQWQAEQEITAS